MPEKKRRKLVHAVDREKKATTKKPKSKRKVQARAPPKEDDKPKEVKTRGVNPILPKLVGNQKELQEDLDRMGCGLLMEKPWASREKYLLQELIREVAPPIVNGKA